MTSATLHPESSSAPIGRRYPAPVKLYARLSIPRMMWVLRLDEYRRLAKQDHSAGGLTSGIHGSPRGGSTNSRRSGAISTGNAYHE